LNNNKSVPIADYISLEEKTDLLRKWASDGFNGKLGWYRAMTENTHWEHEQRLPAEAFRLSIPVLFIGGARDAPAPAVLGNLATKPLCENYTGTIVDSGHWMLREKPTEWMEAVQPWLQANF
jgi:soluble epoxide hydrolase/lipid-phosphate phosphatase